MIEQIIDLVKKPNNIIAIILFVISVIIAFYFYFKSLYRIVYSTEMICKRNNDYIDWGNKENILTTRLLFYNNGRKTITKDEIKTFNIKTNGKINNTYVLNGINHFDIEKSENELKIKINSLNTSKYFVLEITHTGNLKVNGKVAETGDFLHTETHIWLIINVLFFIYITINIMYHFITNLNQSEYDVKNLKSFGFNFLIIYFQFSFIRYIHKIFFIPDSITSKYLNTDKWGKEFFNRY